jgi:hypothetical protein
VTAARGSTMDHAFSISLVVSNAVAAECGHPGRGPHWIVG